MADTAPTSVIGGPAEGRREALTPERIDAVLADFRAWLEGLAAEDRPDLESAVESPVDLAAMVAAFTALRHEIHLHTKAARAQSEQAAEIAAKLDARLRDAESGSRSPEIPVDAVLEAADVLMRVETGLRRALEESARTPAWRRWFAPRQDAFAAAVEGVSLGVQRLNRMLITSGLETIATVGQPFDPETMEAVEAVESRSMQPGTVVEEIRRGYRRDGRVVRIALVKVARSEMAGNRPV